MVFSFLYSRSLVKYMLVLQTWYNLLQGLVVAKAVEKRVDLNWCSMWSTRVQQCIGLGHDGKHYFKHEGDQSNQGACKQTKETLHERWLQSGLDMWVTTSRFFCISFFCYYIWVYCVIIAQLSVRVAQFSILEWILFHVWKKVAVTYFWDCTFPACTLSWNMFAEVLVFNERAFLDCLLLNCSLSLLNIYRYQAQPHCYGVPCRPSWRCLQESHRRCREIFRSQT